LPSITVLAAALFVASSAAAQGADPPGAQPLAFELLLEGPAGAPADVATASHVRRARAVVVPTELPLASVVKQGTRLGLQLFADRRIIALVEHVEIRGNRQATWHARLAPPDLGTALFVMENDVVVGNIEPEREDPYELRFLGSGRHVVRQLDPRRGPGCGVTGKVSMPIELPPPPPPGGDDGSHIDLMVAYTEDARLAQGGLDGIRALIDLCLAVSNTVYANSGITQRVRLAWRQETGYDEAGNTMGTHLDRLEAAGDGFMDDLLVARDDNGCDLVALLVDDSDGGTIAGIASLCGGGGNNADLAFSVNSEAFAAAPSFWSFTHEVGHNMGADHDILDSPFCGFLPYSLGLSFVGSTATWRTIMVRDSQPGMRIQYFSNPNVSFDGQPTGIAQGNPGASDNALTLNTTDANVAAYRLSLPEIIWVDFAFGGGFQNGTQSFPYDTLAEAAAAVAWGGTIRIKAGSSSETPTFGGGNGKPVWVESSGGSAVIGL
jgi:hypothetical protein